jgi:hypothetical protein
MAPTAKKTAKAKKATRLYLPDASASRQRAVVRDMNKVLLAHGVTGKISELHLTAAASTDADCPPGQTKQVVCRKQPNGNFICREECV